MYKYWFLCLFLPPISLLAEPVNSTDVMVVYRAKDNFETVKFNLETAITDQGVTINNTLHISEALNRTGKDLGFPNPVYVKAEALEFCSILFAQRMMRANPANVAACPLTIAIYITVAEPKQVYVAFRKPVLAAPSQPLAREMEDWLRKIVQDAVEK